MYLNRDFVPYLASYGRGAMAILSLKEGMEKKIFKIIIIIFWYFWIKELPFECNNAHLSGLFLENLKIESTLAHRLSLLNCYPRTIKLPMYGPSPRW